MKKRLVRKALSFTLFLGMVLSCNSYAGATDNRAAIAKATNVLLQSGWTQDEIDDLLTEEALLEYTDASPAIVSEKKYFRVGQDGVEELTEVQCKKDLEIIEALQVEPGSRVSPASKIPVGGLETDEVTTTDGYMVYYASVYSAGNDEYILSARFEWLKSPFFTDTDVFALGFGANLTRLDDHDVYYIYKADYKKGYESQTPTGTYERNLAQVDVKYDSGGVIISQDLATGAWGAPGSGISYSNHRGFLQYRVKVNNAAATMASIHVFYYHQQHILSVSPSVSWPRSASLSVSPASKFKEMTPNPYVSFEV